MSETNPDKVKELKQMMGEEESTETSTTVNLNDDNDLFEKIREAIKRRENKIASPDEATKEENSDNDEENKNKLYDEQYDAFYNADTGEWLEGTCDDPDCRYCNNRPEKKSIASQIENLNKVINDSYRRIEQLQEECPHQEKKIITTSSFNPAKVDLLGLTYYRCPECMKEWTEKISRTDNNP